MSIGGNAATATTATNATNIITFRSADDDGTIVPSDDYTLDTLLQGGDFNPVTVLGVQPAEIVIDGDSYLSSISSHAPEEMVPGATYDNLNMIVTTGLYNNTAAFTASNAKFTFSIYVKASGYTLFYISDIGSNAFACVDTDAAVVTTFVNVAGKLFNAAVKMAAFPALKLLESAVND